MNSHCSRYIGATITDLYTIIDGIKTGKSHRGRLFTPATQKFTMIGIFNFEIKCAFETIQRKGKMIIPRNAIEGAISIHTEKYPNLGKLKDIPLKMANPTVVDRIPGIEVYRNHPISRIIFKFGSGEAAYG